jgi:hypothetical protein
MGGDFVFPEAQPACATFPHSGLFVGIVHIKEHSRRPSPAGRPQPLAFDGTSLWMGSWDTDHIYELDPKSGASLRDVPAPGKPYGLAVVGDGLRAVVSIGEDDDRYFYRFTSTAGFDQSSETACPEFTGSHFCSDGSRLYLAQMHYRKVLVMQLDGTIEREIALPSAIGGLAIHDGTLYVIAADEEFEDLRFATLALDGTITEIASIPFGARSLAFDGNVWWTSDREESQIVSFTA